MEHRKKAELALDMVQSARQNGIDFQWVGGDAFYGDDPDFLRQLDQMGEPFMLDIHKDQSVYLIDPAPYVPERKSNRGKIPTRLKTDHVAVEVGQWADEQSKSAWEKMLIRNSTKGFIPPGQTCPLCQSASPRGMALGRQRTKGSQMAFGNKRYQFVKEQTKI